MIEKRHRDKTERLDRQTDREETERKETDSRQRKTERHLSLFGAYNSTISLEDHTGNHTTNGTVQGIIGTHYFH